MSPRHIDQIARDLAGGEISRRSALKRLAGAGLGIGAAMAPAGVAEAMAGCPGDRVKCQGKCCPKNARCKNGKCKCKSGYTKCGKKCVDTDTSVKHCGECGNVCDEGRACVDGECTQCSTPGECPAPGDCQVATCDQGFCGTVTAKQGTPCSGGTCDDSGNCVPDEDLCAGVTCTQQDQCHDVGVCNPDTGACSNPPKIDGAPCNDGNACTQSDTCQGGVCVGGSPVNCTPSDACHDAGTCNPATGQCSNPLKPGIGAGCDCGGEQGVIVCDPQTGTFSCDCP